MSFKAGIKWTGLLACIATAGIFAGSASGGGIGNELGTANGVTYRAETQTFIATGNGSMKIQCPAGKKATGGGFNGEADAMLARGLAPYDGPDKGKVPDDGWRWDITAGGLGFADGYAICAKGAFRYVTETAKVRSGKAKNLTAMCPKGTRVVGGGGVLGQQNVIGASYPVDGKDNGNAPDDGWRVRTFGEQTKTGKVYAVCSKTKVAYKSPNAIPVNPGTGFGFSGVCPAARSVLSAGAQVTGNPEQFELTRLYPIDNGSDGDSTPDDGGTSFVRVNEGPPKNYTPFAICR